MPHPMCVEPRPESTGAIVVNVLWNWDGGGRNVSRAECKTRFLLWSLSLNETGARPDLVGGPRTMMSMKMVPSFGTWCTGA